MLFVFTFAIPFTIYAETGVTEPEPGFSRKVSAAVGQIVEIPFRGIEWVFVGELNSLWGMSIDTRRYDIEGYTFIFRAEAPGTYSLKFSRHDFDGNVIMDDLVQLTVGEAPQIASSGSIDPGRVIAEPRWPRNDNPAVNNPAANPPVTTADAQDRLQETARAPQASAVGVPPARETPQVAQAPQPVNPVPQVQSTASPATSAEAPTLAPNSVQFQERDSLQTSSVPVINAPLVTEPRNNEPALSETSVQEASAVPAQDRPVGPAPEDYINWARQEFNAGRIESGLSILADFAVQYPSGTDEAWWLYAQFLEANSPSRDIKLALEYYRRLVQEFPQSNRASDAQRRIAYLERFFVNIW
jgi:TolA-binding protein